MHRVLPSTLYAHLKSQDRQGLRSLNGLRAWGMSVEVVATGLNVPYGTLSALRVAPEVREVSPASVALLHSAAK